eukprot:6210724-Pleurochrysis_carterae.AAC.6
MVSVSDESCSHPVPEAMQCTSVARRLSARRRRPSLRLSSSSIAQLCGLLPYRFTQLCSVYAFAMTAPRHAKNVADT